MIGRDIRIHSPAEDLAKSSKMVSGIASPLGKRDALPDQVTPRSIPPILFLVEVNGFEPMTSCVQGRRSHI